MPQPWVFLADPAVARRLQITPQHRAEIARIDAELDREAQKMMQAAIQRWEQRGGFHVAPIPNFRDGSNSYGRQLNALKRAAEDKIARLLSEEEKSRWIQEQPPMPAVAAHPVMQSAL
jgi:hypothetical protein